MSTEADLQLSLARCLCKSIEKCEIGLIKQLLVFGANPNLLMPEGLTPFHLAVGMDYSNAVTVTEILLSEGANPNVRSSEGLTPVHVSASWGTIKILEVLLDNGGDPFAQDCEGKDALDLADEHQQCDATRTLLTHIRRNKEPSVTESLEETINSLNIRFNQVTVRRRRQKPKRSSSLQLPKLFPELQCCTKLPVDDSSCSSNNSVRLRRISDSYVTYRCSSSTLSDVTSLPEAANDEPSKIPTELNNAVVFDSNNCFVPDTTASEDETKSRVSSVYMTCGDTILDGSNDKNSSLEDFRLVPDQIISCDPTTQRLLDQLTSNPRTISLNARKDSDWRLCKEGYFAQSQNEKYGFIEKRSADDSSLQELLNSYPRSRNSDKDRQKSRSCDNLTIHFSWNSTILDPVGDRTFVKPRNKSSDSTISHSWKSYRSDSDSGDSPFSNIVTIPSHIEQLSNSQLRAKLIALGDTPGPICNATRRPYLLRLARIETQALSLTISTTPSGPAYSKELLRVLKGKLDLPAMQELERDMSKSFLQSNAQWREGNSKCCFNYLLLDPRVTQNLPHRANSLLETESFDIFLASIFYIGKGKRARPYSHLNEAKQYQNKPSKSPNAKIRHILDIWKEKMGVVSLHCFQNVIPVEAYTREACMVEAIRLDNLTNARHGETYGAVANWSTEKRRQLGSFLLFKALRLFENEGEQQIFPTDL